MKAVYKVVADTEHMLHRETWNRPGGWRPLKYDSLEDDGKLYLTKEGAEQYAQKRNHILVDLIGYRLNDLRGIKMGKGAAEFRHCLDALKKKTYRVETLPVSDR